MIITIKWSMVGLQHPKVTDIERYSASARERDTVCYFFDFQEMGA